MRRLICWIPKQPTLLHGSIRQNLDPLEIYSDEELWTVLSLVGLAVFIKQQCPHKLQEIVHSLNDSRSRWSPGQQQLLCIARALLRNPKVMILDEATSHLDEDTESSIIQQIRIKYSECTLLAITGNRLKSILHCDRVIVFDNGFVIENDKPAVMLSKPHSVFYKLYFANCML